MGISCAIRESISGCVEDAQAEQAEFGAAIHGTLDKLQTVAMSFDGSVAAGWFERCKESSLVTAQVFSYSPRRCTTKTAAWHVDAALTMFP